MPNARRNLDHIRSGSDHSHLANSLIRRYDFHTNHLTNIDLLDYCDLCR
jgi:hypothetical protein